MTVQEAISCLKSDKEYLKDHNICDGEEIGIAIEALEKSIPKKPIMVKDTAETYYICSECEMEVDKFDDNYCSDCGQKLDWGGISMTMQEAISCLKADKKYLVDNKVCDGEEIDVAINSMEQQMNSCNNCKHGEATSGAWLYCLNLGCFINNNNLCRDWEGEE